MYRYTGPVRIVIHSDDDAIRRDVMRYIPRALVELGRLAKRLPVAAGIHIAQPVDQRRLAVVESGLPDHFNVAPFDSETYVPSVMYEAGALAAAYPAQSRNLAVGRSRFSFDGGAVIGYVQIAGGIHIAHMYPQGVAQPVEERCLAVVESGLLDHFSVAPFDPETYMPSVMYEAGALAAAYPTQPHVVKIDDGTLMFASHDHSGTNPYESDISACSNLIGNIAVSVGDFPPANLVSDPAAFCAEYDALYAQKLVQYYAPPQAFTGKLALLVAAKYGTPGTVYSGPVPTQEAPYLHSVELDGIAAYVGQLGMRNGGAKSSFLHTSPGYDYTLITLGPKQIEVVPLNLSECGREIRSKLINGDYPDAEKRRLEFAMLSGAVPSTANITTQGAEHHLVNDRLLWNDTFAYGWKSNDDGSEIACVFYRDYDGPPVGGFGPPYMHTRLVRVRVTGNQDAGFVFDVQEESEHKLYKHANAPIWAFTPECLIGPGFDRDCIQASSDTAAAAPFHCYYDEDDDLVVWTYEMIALDEDRIHTVECKAGVPGTGGECKTSEVGSPPTGQAVCTLGGCNVSEGTTDTAKTFTYTGVDPAAVEHKFSANKHHKTLFADNQYSSARLRYEQMSTTNEYRTRDLLLTKRPAVCQTAFGGGPCPPWPNEPTVPGPAGQYIATEEYWSQWIGTRINQWTGDVTYETAAIIPQNNCSALYLVEKSVFGMDNAVGSSGLNRVFGEIAVCQDGYVCEDGDCTIYNPGPPPSANSCGCPTYLISPQEGIYWTWGGFGSGDTTAINGIYKYMSVSFYSNRGREFLGLETNVGPGGFMPMVDSVAEPELSCVPVTAGDIVENPLVDAWDQWLDFNAAECCQAGFVARADVSVLGDFRLHGIDYSTDLTHVSDAKYGEASQVAVFTGFG